LTSDTLGTPRINTNENGAVISRHDYHPFGEEIVSSQRTTGIGYQPDDNRKQFTGYERDNESGLEFAQARFYNSTHGRFVQSDEPFADQNESDPQSWNLYAYSGNNPISHNDPTGRGWVEMLQKIKNGLLYGHAETDADLETHRKEALEYLQGLEAEYGGIYFFVRGEGYRRVDLSTQGPGAVIDLAAFYRKAIDDGNASILTPDQARSADRRGPLVVDALPSLPAGNAVEQPNIEQSDSNTPPVDDGKQGKHTPGHNNYQAGRSVLTADANQLARRAGTGQQIGNIPVGQPGSKERIDFGKIIGNYVDKNGHSMPTTKAIIHYSTSGIHIVPSRP
jgi:RHS repeat-associated protein